MTNRQTRSRTANAPASAGSQDGDIPMGEPGQVEIPETGPPSTNPHSTHTVDMDVDPGQAALPFAEGGELDEETEYLRLKRAEEKAIRTQELNRLRERERQN